MAIDDERRIRRFIKDNPIRASIAECFERAGFRIVRVIDRQSGTRWAMHVKPDARHRRLFATGRDVLVWVVQSADFQTRIVTEANKIIFDSRPQLSEDFALILTHSVETTRLVAAAGASFDTHYIGYSIREFVERFGAADSTGLEVDLQRQLYSRDLYDLPTAATSREDFFGRRGTVSEIGSTLRLGSRHIGLFGLRKIGKTSLLFRLASDVRNSGAAFAAHLDIERVDAINPSLNYMLWSLGEAIWDCHIEVRNRGAECRLFGRYKLFADILDKSSVVELFEYDLRQLTTNSRKPLILMLDEVELMSPLLASSRWEDTFVRFWRLLRGFDQQFPHRVSFLVAGTNPNAFETSELGGLENPAYNYLSVRFLGPLSYDEASDLLRVLGSRMGIDWQEEALLRAFRATGGHPALLRALGSLVHQHRTTLGQSFVNEELIAGLVQRFLVERSSLVSQILAVVEESYEDEYMLLSLLAVGNISEFREYARSFPGVASHLVGYGLCADPFSSTRLTMEIVQSYLQQRSRRPVSASRVVPIQFGERVGDYVIEATVGRPGGFSTVYRATMATNSQVDFALKVLTHGSLGALQREVDPLASVSHPHIVKVFDYGTDTFGRVFLVMEYLEGETLDAFCTMGSRPSSHSVLKWWRCLADALVSIHPNVAKIEEAREIDEMSEAKFAELLMARHGYIHRDIKPENIILAERGPVLIDFNISVRSASPALTVSATPGYLPPDRNVLQWDPDVDLYQLGLTMTQCYLGLKIEDTSPDELRKALHESEHCEVLELLLRSTDPVRSNRFGSASELLDALRDIG